MSFDENNDLDHSQNRSVVKEQVKPKFKRKLKKFIGVLFLTLVSAVIFGFVARLAFIKSEDLAYKIFGIEKETTDDTHYNIILSGDNVDASADSYVYIATNGNDNLDITVTSSPVANNNVPSQNPVEDDNNDSVPSVDNPTDNNDVVDVPETIDNSTSGTASDGESVVADGMSIAAGNTDVNKDTSEVSNDTEDNTIAGITLKDYMGLMDELHTMTAKINTGIVTVKAVTSTVNWMGDDMETTTETFGGYFADNGYDYLFVTYYDKIINADSIKVVLCSGNEYKANLFERDSTYNLAIIAVPMRLVSEADRAMLNKLVFSSEADTYAGMPIIAMGRPNGFDGSLEYGYVTSSDNRLYVVDGELNVFTTDITNSQDSEGIIVDYSGEVVGVIIRTLDVAQRDVASCSIGIESISELIVEMCNGKERPLVGIHAENIPEEALTDLGKENGIYINDVVQGSPAEEAGLRKGDIILQVGEEKIGSVAEFMKLVVAAKDGDGVELTVYRSSRVSNPEFNVTVYPKKK